MNIRIFAIKRDYIYKWKNRRVLIKKGTTFFGGVMCQWPALYQYSTVYNGKRLWFDKKKVENSPRLFLELFTPRKRICDDCKIKNCFIKGLRNKRCGYRSIKNG